MTATVLGALATAGALGVTHAIEPDHVAGISSLTSDYGDSRLSALVGACFSLGHVLLVVAWLAVGYLLLGRTAFPAVFDRIGTVGVVVLLGALGTVTALRGIQTLRHTHVHEHDGDVHAHPHVHFPFIGGDHEHDEHAASNGEGTDRGHGDGRGDDRDGVVPHDHGHGVRAYLRTGVVGALFTLSPPVSMIVFASTLFPTYGGSVVALAVAAYAIGIVATMSLLGAGVGTLYDLATVSHRVSGAVRVVTGAAVVAFAGWTVVGLV